MKKKNEKYSSLKHNIKLVSSICSWTLFILLFIIAGFLVYYFVSMRAYKEKGTDYRPAFGLYTIVSPSMEPNLKIYDVIVNVGVDSPEDIKVGDVITFISTANISKGMTITHRVIAITDGPEGKLYQTKGDNNLSPDNAPAAYKNVLGKVLFKIPQLGRVQMFLSTKWGWLMIVVLPAVIIVLQDIRKLFRLKEAEEDMKEIDDLTVKRNEEKENVRNEIEERLSKKYKQKRSLYEKEPLREKNVIISVSNKKTDIAKDEDLPKLKKKEKVSDISKQKRTRKRKKKAL